MHKRRPKHNYLGMQNRKWSIIQGKDLRKSNIREKKISEGMKITHGIKSRVSCMLDKHASSPSLGSTGNGLIPSDQYCGVQAGMLTPDMAASSMASSLYD